MRRAQRSFLPAVISLLIFALFAGIVFYGAGPSNSSWRPAARQSAVSLSTIDSELVRFLSAQDPNDIVLFVAAPPVDMPNDLADFLENAGGKIARPMLGRSYIGVFHGRRIAFERSLLGKNAKVTFAKGKRIGDITFVRKIRLVSPVMFPNAAPRIEIDELNHAIAARGWHGVVLDNSGRIKKTFTADTAALNFVRVQEYGEDQMALAAVTDRIDSTKQATLRTMKLRIEDAQLEILRARRNKALALGVLMDESSENEFVPAMLQFEGKDIPVEVRLKGDWTDHFATGRWSFRIKVKGNRALDGMRTFSVQRPETRDYLTEWFFHAIWSDLGGIAPRAELVHMTVNDIALGPYILEEHFEKELVEFHERREGPILKFDETHLWQQYASLGDGLSTALPVAPVRAFGEGKISHLPNLRRNYAYAVSMLRKFREGKVPAAEIFDERWFAKYFALTNVFGFTHPLSWHNIRLYFNPISSRFEPVSFDISGGSSFAGVFYSPDRSDFSGMLFASRTFLEFYFAELLKFSDRNFIVDAADRHSESLGRYTAAIQSIKPGYRFAVENITRIQEKVQLFLSLENLLDVYLDTVDGRDVQFQITTLQRLPFEILGVSVEDYLYPLAEPAPIVDFSTSIQAVKVKLSSSVRFPEDLRRAKLVYKIPGIDRKRFQPLNIVRYGEVDNVRASLHAGKTDFTAFNFIVVDDNARTISFLPGTWQLKQELVIPPGYQVMIPSGVSLDLVENAQILCSSAITIKGTQQKPVRIYSSDSTARGLFIREAPTTTIEHAEFKNLSNYRTDHTTLTGAITIYRSKVAIHKTLFADNRSEDALNILNSQFKVTDTEFRNTKYDAFDSDFSDGECINCIFRKIGNDGLDVSGSVVKVQGINVYGCGDKGVSVGERSVLTGQKVHVERCQVGIASKDSSQAVLSQVDVDSSKIILAAYQKKPEFGPARLALTEFSQKGRYILDYAIDEKSSLTLNGEPFESKNKKKSDLVIKSLILGKKIG